MVKCVNVRKVYMLGKVAVEALRGVNMEVRYGEFIAIMGPSGSGKTTLLNIIGTLDRPTTGKVYIDGQDITPLSDRELTELRRRKIGFVFQFYNLIPTLTALENVELPMQIAGVNFREARERAMKLLEIVGLKERMHHRPDELSGGEQQRVAIARALANRPSIILADEPTGDLDSKTGMEIIELLYRLSREEHVTVIVATHDPMVANFADRILLLKDGVIKGEKRPKR
ncbi:ABC transporter ATP-binding protein [archaeon]|nr:ABC transporter ATP-binding protein [archaeon]